MCGNRVSVGVRSIPTTPSKMHESLACRYRLRDINGFGNARFVSVIVIWPWPRQERVHWMLTIMEVTCGSK